MSTQSTFPTPEEFYLQYPLYEAATASEQDEEAAISIKHYDGPLDSFCVDCSRHTVFLRMRDSPGAGDWELEQTFTVTFRCSRNANHRLRFHFRKEGPCIQKIGQFPSLADLSLYDVAEYSVLLDSDTYRELKTAIGLAAHGVGVGSFVYLRRIFEGLISDACVEVSSNPEFGTAEFERSRMDEKIKMLEDVLPPFLVENRRLYGILSKGIHELTDRECLDAFPATKAAIEVILDQKLFAKKQADKVNKATQSIQGLLQGETT